MKNELKVEGNYYVIYKDGKELCKVSRWVNNIMVVMQYFNAVWRKDLGVE